MAPREAASGAAGSAVPKVENLAMNAKQGGGWGGTPHWTAGPSSRLRVSMTDGSIATPSWRSC